MKKKKITRTGRRPRGNGLRRRRIAPQKVLLQVQSVPALPVIPTASDLAEPIREGKSLTIPKTWLSEKQITRLVEKTPRQYVYTRPAKGGGKWDYVTVSYVQRVLDYAFGFNWDFDVVQHGKEADHVWVLGKLTVYSPDGTRKISKTQFGRSEVKHKKDSKELLDYGNDLKAAASDALKKCASMLGIARDIYGKADYKQETGNLPSTPQNTPINENLGVSKPKEGQVAGPDGNPTYLCYKCAAPISDQEAEYSQKMFGKRLCRDDQPNKK